MFSVIKNLIALLAGCFLFLVVFEVLCAHFVLLGEDIVMIRAVGFDDCIIGVCTRIGEVDVIAYSVNKIISQLCRVEGMNPEEAVEYFEFNIAGSHVGELTPCFIYEDYDLGGLEDDCE
jgi:hypothetical protein